MYESPAPTINLFLRFGVLLFPSHKTNPLGIAFAAPDQIIIPPLGIPTGTVIVSKLGSAPLFARKNLPSLDDVPCSNLASVTASSASFEVLIARSAILAVVT